MALRTITDTVKDAQGANALGYLEISWPGFKTADSVTIAPGKLRFPGTGNFANGAISLSLHQTTGGTPSGVSYEVRYVIFVGSVREVRTERWQVGSAGPYTIPDVRIATTPSPTATTQLGQLAQGGAADGDHLAWSSSGVTWQKRTLVPVANGGTNLASGTSGGVLGYTAAGVLASSPALTSNGVVYGRGAGNTPTATAPGTADQVFRVPGAGGTPAFGTVDISKAAAVTGILAVANLHETAIQYAAVALTNAQIKALRATPITMVSSPGAGKVVEFLSAMLLLDFGTNVFAEAGDNLAFRYNNGLGVAISETIETTGWIDQAVDTATTARAKLDAIASKTACENLPVVLHNIGGAEFAGNVANDNLIRVKVAYRVHTTGW